MALKEAFVFQEKPPIAISELDDFRQKGGGVLLNN
jgi:hypothetical protein